MKQAIPAVDIPAPCNGSGAAKQVWQLLAEDQEQSAKHDRAEAASKGREAAALDKEAQELDSKVVEFSEVIDENELTKSEALPRAFQHFTELLARCKNELERAQTDRDRYRQEESAFLRRAEEADRARMEMLEMAERLVQWEQDTAKLEASGERDSKAAALAEGKAEEARREAAQDILEEEEAKWSKYTHVDETGLGLLRANVEHRRKRKLQAADDAAAAAKRARESEALCRSEAGALRAMTAKALKAGEAARREGGGVGKIEALRKALKALEQGDGGMAGGCGGREGAGPRSGAGRGETAQG